MFKRKIEDKLSLWKETQKRKPLVIKGCRQCGKTSSVMDFAKTHYSNVVCLNFHEHKSAFLFAVFWGEIRYRRPSCPNRLVLP
ncbi:MAG: AAA family ATPase [Lepagella sp.]